MDHIELFVPSREQAANWYRRALGFEVLEKHRHWAVEGGPLMISNDGGETMLALFRGQPQGELPVSGLRRLAFRTDAAGWIEFLRGSGSWRQPALSGAEVQDHDQSLSVYFSDPWGNPLEVTTYQAEEARRLLAT
jgi:catechol-2,3-dioxygenase